MTHVRKSTIATPKDEMRTPPLLYQKLDTRFKFDLDVACTRENCLSRNKYGYTKEDNALVQNWNEFMMDNGEYASSFFGNPPYNRVDLRAFVNKAYAESLKNEC